MTDWIPGLGAELRVRAEQLAQPTTARAVRRRGRTTIAVVVGLLGLSSAAYAAQELWRPQIGGDASTAVATAEAPASEMLDAFAVLRREQTERDRSAEAAYALRFATSDVVSVKTNYVRVLGENHEGQPIVLIPQATTEGEALCLWVQSPTYAGGQACQSVQRAIEGSLVIGRGTGDGSLAVVGLVRDGAATAKVGDHPDPAPVDNNIFQTVVDEDQAGTLNVSTFDVDGEPFTTPRPLAVNKTPTEAQYAALQRHLSRYKIGDGYDAVDYVQVAIALCPLIGADPRPSETALQDQAIERFRAAGVSGFDRRNAAVVLEVTSLAFCLRRPD